MAIEELKVFMTQWNNRFPYDRWYRKKHRIAFMSRDHMECSFLHEIMEYEEDKLFDRIIEEKVEENSDLYVPNIGQWLKTPIVNQGDEISKSDIEAFQEEVLQIEQMEKEMMNK